MDKIFCSVVVPVYNEANAVASLHGEIVRVMVSLGKNFEVIFIDDGSEDETFKELRTLRPIRIIRFRKNFGQTAAMDAGFKAARGEIVIAMDGDGQNDPADIPNLLKKLDEGYDVVSGWRKKRKDSFTKRFCSRGAHFIRSLLINDGIHDSGCTLKTYRKECFTGVDLYGEMHRFIPAILELHGFRIGEMVVNHRPRTTGKTKYTWKRTVKGFLDMISVAFWKKYADRPLHLFGGLGFFISGSGFILGFYLAVLRFLGKISLAGRIWPLVAVFMVLVGLQLFIAGLMADIAIKTYYRENKRPYVIRDEVEQL